MIVYISRILYNIQKKTTECASICASVPSISNAFFLATVGSILTKVGTKVGTDNGFLNPEDQDDRSHGPDSIYYNKKCCPYVSIFFSLAYFSATALSIWTNPDRKVGTVNAFINPEN